MDTVVLLLVVLLLILLVGGVGWPRPTEGAAVVNLVLYVLAAIVLAIILLRLLGVLV
jgi:hypothetical protein